MLILMWIIIHIPTKEKCDFDEKSYQTSQASSDCGFDGRGAARLPTEQLLLPTPHDPDGPGIAFQRGRVAGDSFPYAATIGHAIPHPTTDALADAGTDAETHARCASVAGVRRLTLPRWALCMGGVGTSE